MCVVCVCSPTYPSCNAHAPYCRLWPARLYNIFPHYLINGTIFEKKVTEHKTCVLISSTTSTFNISHSKKNSARYDQKSILVVMQSTSYSCPDVIKLEVSGQFFFFEKYSNVMKIRSVGAKLFHEDRRTDVHDEANSRF